MAGAATGLAVGIATLSSANTFDAEIFTDADAAGELTTSITMAASVSGVAATLSDLTLEGETAEFYAEIFVTATVTGSISNDFYGDISGIATAQASTLLTEIRLAAMVDGVATITADFTVPRAIIIFTALDMTPMVTINSLAMAPSVTVNSVSLGPA
jgi:hypothetical protein